MIAPISVDMRLSSLNTHTHTHAWVIQKTVKCTVRFAMQFIPILIGGAVGLLMQLHSKLVNVVLVSQLVQTAGLSGHRCSDCSELRPVELFLQQIQSALHLAALLAADAAQGGAEMRRGRREIAAGHLLILAPPTVTPKTEDIRHTWECTWGTHNTHTLLPHTAWFITFIFISTLV